MHDVHRCEAVFLQGPSFSDSSEELLVGAFFDPLNPRCVHYQISCLREIRGHPRMVVLPSSSAGLGNFPEVD